MTGGLEYVMDVTGDLRKSRNILAYKYLTCGNCKLQVD